MGKATILSGGDDGKYSVKLDYGKAARDAKVKRINDRLTKLGPQISEAESKLDAQKIIETSKRAAVSSAIASFIAAANAVPRVQDAVDKALKAYTQAGTALNKEKGKTGALTAALEILQTEQAQLKKDKVYWTNLVLEDTKDVWCADLTQDGTGDVATIEIPGESKHTLIAPEARKPTDADGVMMAREVQSGAQVFFNAAILPGWQKFKPTFRAGTITDIDYAKDTADVTLSEADVSSAQKLKINQTDTLEKVPVEYMSCNSAAFNVGDVCVVQFESQDWAKPKVIGFFDNPKPCGSGIGITYAGAEGTAHVVLTPSGKYMEPTGNWRAKPEKTLTGGRYPWSSSSAGQYAVSTGGSGDGLKYNGFAVTNKRDGNISLTFGGEFDGAPYIAQAGQGGSTVRLYVAPSPKKLRALRSYKLAEKAKAFEIDATPQEITGQLVGVSADGAKMLVAGIETESTPTYFAYIGNYVAKEASFVQIAIPTSAITPTPVLETEITVEYPSGSPENPGNDLYFASKNRYAVQVDSTRYGNTTHKEWLRTLDAEIQRGILQNDAVAGMYLKADGSVGQDRWHVVQSRTGELNNTGTGGAVYGDNATNTADESHRLTEVCSAVVNGFTLKLSDVDITDSGTGSGSLTYTKNGSTIEEEWESLNITDRTCSLSSDAMIRYVRFLDRQFGVVVYLEMHSIISDGFTSNFTEDIKPLLGIHNSTYTETPGDRTEDNEARLVVWHNGAEIYERPVFGKLDPNRRWSEDKGDYSTYIRGYNEDDAFVGGEGSFSSALYYTAELGDMFSLKQENGDTNVSIQSAKDPLTGALVLHVNIANDGLGGADAKWFVFDGGSAKTISSVSEIPDSAVPSAMVSI